MNREGRFYAVLRNARCRGTLILKRLSHAHPTAYIHRTASVSHDLIAAEYVYIGPGCLVPPSTTIGAYTMLAPYVALVGGDHVWDAVGTPIQFTGRPPQASTSIGRDVWIGHGAIISTGVTVGEGAIVGAGAVVTGDVPPFEVWVGVPARKLRDRFAISDRERHRMMLDAGSVVPRFAPPKGKLHDST